MYLYNLILQRTTGISHALQKSFTRTKFHENLVSRGKSLELLRPEPKTVLIQKRKFSTTNEPKENIATYEEIKNLSNHPEVLLIDVREPEEIKETGKIPTSINIPLLIQKRKFSTTNEPKENIATYEEIKNLPNHPEVLLIDVREPEEIKETGKIPTSINIPLGAIKRAFSLPQKYFLKRYNFKKPETTVKVIFSCHSGKRAQQAIEIVKILGYTNVKNYKGSWSEWAEREGLPK